MNCWDIKILLKGKDMCQADTKRGSFNNYNYKILIIIRREFCVLCLSRPLTMVVHPFF
jgi:hypothetical protein